MTDQEKKLELFINGIGLRHFKGAELTPYWSRTRGTVMNAIPPQDLWANIIDTLLVADEIRERLRDKVTITSSYRSPAYNNAVGGERMSYHQVFMALDLQSPAGAKKLWEVAKSVRGTRINRPGGRSWFIWRGGIGKYPTFVHIDTRGRDANW